MKLLEEAPDEVRKANVCEVQTLAIRWYAIPKLFIAVYVFLII